MFRNFILTTATAASLIGGLSFMSGAAQADPWDHRWNWRGSRFFININEPSWHPYCHPDRIWFHGHWHPATVCNGHIQRIW